MTKRLNPAISACSVCGVAADEQCVSLRTGKPNKRDHEGGRAITVSVLRPSQLASQLPQPDPDGINWAGDCTALFKQLPGVQAFLKNPS